MTTAYLVAACACWCGAGAAVAWRLTSDHYRFRLSEATASAARYKAWWERDSGKALIAQAELDLIAEQRRSAGRQSHKAQNALFAATTEKLKQCVASRDAERGPLDTGGIAAPVNRTARQDQPPAEPLSSCRGSAARKQDRIGGASTRSGRQDAGPSLYRRGQSLPADTPEMKGL